MNWINVKNKLPEYQWILSINEEWYNTTLVLGCSIDVNLFDPKNDEIDFKYWMPLPKLPKNN